MDQKFPHSTLVEIIIVIVVVILSVALVYSTQKASELYTSEAPASATQQSVTDTGAAVVPTPSPLSVTADFPVSTSTIDVFTASPRSSYTSNVVGYFAGGEFVMTVPDWLVEHWKWDSSVPDKNVISPKVELDSRDFSDIVITLATTTETYNANTLYSAFQKYGVDENPNMTTETILSSNGSTYIYHVQTISDNQFTDTYFLDGRTKTAKVTFSGSLTNYLKYTTKVKEFVKGLLSGKATQG